jgi:hypothetical protein
MKTDDKDAGYLVIDGMHRVTAVQNLLKTGVLLVADNDHMVHTRKARAENV